MKFIGHLDVMRYFQKCMRRADIDIAYSEGFSPHQIMSFASPLGVGITSDGEYLDIEAHSTRSSKESVEALNQVMAEGIEVVSYRRLCDSDKKAMSIVEAADYMLLVKDGYEAPKADSYDLNRFFTGQEEILVTKQTKKGERVIDLKRLVYDFKIIQKDEKDAFYIKLSAGSVDNVKPELVLSSFYQFLGLTYDPLSVQIHRIDVYAGKDGALISLGEMGEIIG